MEEAIRAIIREAGDVLFGCDDLPFHCLFIVRSSAGGTQAVHIVLDIVVAELADLEWSVSKRDDWILFS
jgi:hypothetical protein